MKYKNLPFIAQCRFLTTLWMKPFENIAGKGEKVMHLTTIFSFSHDFFYPFTEDLLHLNHIVGCKCFLYGQF